MAWLHWTILLWRGGRPAGGQEHIYIYHTCSCMYQRHIYFLFIHIYAYIHAYIQYTYHIVVYLFVHSL